MDDNLILSCLVRSETDPFISRQYFLRYGKKKKLEEIEESNPIGLVLKVRGDTIWGVNKSNSFSLYKKRKLFNKYILQSVSMDTLFVRMGVVNFSIDSIHFNGQMNGFTVYKKSNSTGKQIIEIYPIELYSTYRYVKPMELVINNFKERHKEFYPLRDSTVIENFLKQVIMAHR
jgi:hypothetical protein